MIRQPRFLEAIAVDCRVEVWWNDFPIAWVSAEPPSLGHAAGHHRRCSKPVEHLGRGGINTLRVEVEITTGDADQANPGQARCQARCQARVVSMPGADSTTADPTIAPHGAYDLLSVTWSHDDSEWEERLGREPRIERVAAERNADEPPRLWEKARPLTLDHALTDQVDGVLESLANVLRQGAAKSLLDHCRAGLEVFLEGYSTHSMDEVSAIVSMVAGDAAKGTVSLAAPSDRRLRLVGEGRFVQVMRANGDAPIIVTTEAAELAPFDFFIGWVDGRLLLVR